MKSIVSDGRSIDRYIPPHLRNMFYRNPNRRYMKNNGLDPYGFSTNGLVLYLPLWALKDSPFKSVDAYEPTCTVSGSGCSWLPTGRLLNGTDYIDLGNLSQLDFDKDDPFSVLVWVNISTTASGYVVSKIDTARGWGFQITADGLYRIYLYSNAVTSDAIYQLGSTDVGDDAWHLVGFTYSGSVTAAGFTGYLDSGTEALNIQTDGLTGTTKNSVSVNVGARLDGNNLLEGYIGEVWIYDRALPATEVLHNYNVTSWRYQ